MTFHEIISFVIDRFEGGERFTETLGDLGGATKYGITRPFLARALGHPTTREDIRTLTRPQAIDACRIVLIEQARLGLITDWRVLFAVYDFAFNAGEDDAIPALQRAVGAPVDGVIGPQTRAAMNQIDGLTVAVRVIAERQAFHIKRSYAPNQAKFLRGWLSRCTANLSQITKG